MRIRLFVLFTLLSTMFAWAPSARADHALTIATLSQRNSDGTALATGGTAKATAVSLSGVSATGSCSTSFTYRMEVEVRAVAIAFSNVATQTSAYVTRTDCAATSTYTVSVTGLAAGSYKWQARERSTGGTVSPWRVFGTGTAFVIGPALTVSPTSRVFGNQRVGTQSVAQTFTITNVGGTALTVSAITVPAHFVRTSAPTLPLTIAAGGTATFAVAFAPTSTDAKSGNVTITSTSSTGTTTNISVSGVGVASAITLSPASIDFGDQRVGTLSGTTTVTMTNTGTAVLNTTAHTISGPFTVSGLTTGALAVGASKTFTVRFAPTAANGVSGSVSIPSDALGSPTVLALAGNGTASKVLLSPTSLAFGSVRTGSVSTAQTLQLSNGGTASLTLGAATITGPYQVSGLSASTLAVGSALTLNVSCAPTTTNPADGSISIPSDDPASPTLLALTCAGVESKVEVSASSIAFGSQRLGSSVDKTLTLTNGGSAPLNVSALSTAAPFSLVDPLPGAIAAGASVDVRLRFTPTALGNVAGSLSIVSDDPLSPKSVNLSGVGIAGVVIVSPASLSFPDTNVGKSATLDLLVKNEGNSELIVSSLTFGGAAGSDFSSTTPLPFTLAANASHAVTVEFAPSAVGARAGKLGIGTDDPVTPSIDVPLSGTGTSPSISVAPASVDFGPLLVATTSPKTSVTLTNGGTGPLTITGVALGGVDTARFVLDAVTLPIVLAPSASTTLWIAYAPTAVGGSSAKLTITSDAAGAPTVEIPLTGTGTSPKLSVTPAEIDFGGQLVGRTSAPRTVEITNDGSAPLSVTALALSGADAASFALVTTPTLPALIASGAKLTLQVTVLPSAVAPLAAALDITTDAPEAAAAKVTLAGNGISTALTVSPSSLDFGTIKAPGTVAAKTITVTNTSGETFTLKNAVLSPAAGYMVTGLAGTLAPGASKTVDVTFTIAVAGDYASTLTLETTDPAVPTAAVKLTGKGISSYLTVNPTTLDFGEVAVGTSSGAQTITVTNASPSPIKLASASSDDGSFVLSGLDLSLTVAPGKSLSFGVAFVPSQIGLTLAKLPLVIAGASSPEVVIALSGTATSGAGKTDAGVSDASSSDGGLRDAAASDAEVVAFDPNAPPPPDTGNTGCACGFDTRGAVGGSATALLLSFVLLARRRRRDAASA